MSVAVPASIGPPGTPSRVELLSTYVSANGEQNGPRFFVSEIARCTARGEYALQPGELPHVAEKGVVDARRIRRVGPPSSLFGESVSAGDILME